MDPQSGRPETPSLATLLEECERLGLVLDEAALVGFRRYLVLIEEWNERAGLTSLTDSAEMQRRHLAESLALLVALRTAGLWPQAGPRVADLGPGGGFPSIPMRLIEPAMSLVLVESHGRRAEFLRTVVADLALDGVEVVQARAEDAAHAAALRGTFDLVVARALAPLRVLAEYGLPLLREGGLLATPKGSRATEELAEAGRALEMLGGTALQPVALPLEAGAPPQVVLLVRRTGDVPERYPRRAGMPSKRPL